MVENLFLRLRRGRFLKRFQALEQNTAPFGVGHNVSIYRFRFFNDDGFLYETRHPCADDVDALNAAQALAKVFSIEIWTDGRRVARVKPNDAPSDVHDRLAG